MSNQNEEPESEDDKAGGPGDRPIVEESEKSYLLSRSRIQHLRKLLGVSHPAINRWVEGENRNLDVDVNLDSLESFDPDLEPLSIEERKVFETKLAEVAELNELIQGLKVSRLTNLNPKKKPPFTSRLGVEVFQRDQLQQSLKKELLRFFDNGEKLMDFIAQYDGLDIETQLYPEDDQADRRANLAHVALSKVKKMNHDLEVLMNEVDELYCGQLEVWLPEDTPPEISEMIHRRSISLMAEFGFFPNEKKQPGAIEEAGTK